MESYFLKINYFLDNDGRPQWQIMDGRRDVTRDAGYEPMWVISDGRHFFVHFDRTQWNAVRQAVDGVPVVTRHWEKVWTEEPLGDPDSAYQSVVMFGKRSDGELIAVWSKKSKLDSRKYKLDRLIQEELRRHLDTYLNCDCRLDRMCEMHKERHIA